jgi:hypothetical protein
MTIEVFKTNVNNAELAGRIIEKIHAGFEGYKANFDLHDCDRILRVVSTNGAVQSLQIIQVLTRLGCIAEVLQD